MILRTFRGILSEGVLPMSPQVRAKQVVFTKKKTAAQKATGCGGERQRQSGACVCRKLDSAILMVKAAKDRS
jgi:hypothetical protein